MQFSRDELAQLYRAGFSKWDISKLLHSVIHDEITPPIIDIGYVRELMEEVGSGNGRHHTDGSIIQTRTIGDRTFEKIQLESGDFLRIRRGDDVVRLINVTEKRKRLP